MSRKSPRRRRAARPNPKPRAWSTKGPSRAYPCKSPLLGRTVRLGRSEVVVESCATPSRARPGQGQFRVRSKATGKSRAVARRRVSAAIYRAKHPRKMPPGLLTFWAKTRESTGRESTGRESTGRESTGRERRLRVFLGVSDRNNVRVVAVPLDGAELKRSDDDIVFAMEEALPESSLPANGYSYKDNGNTLGRLDIDGPNGLGQFGIRVGTPYVGIDYLRRPRYYDTPDFVREIKKIARPYASEITVLGPGAPSPRRASEKEIPPFVYDPHGPLPSAQFGNGTADPLRPPRRRSPEKEIPPFVYDPHGPLPSAQFGNGTADPLRPPRRKSETFAKARARILGEFKALGWDVHTRNTARGGGQLKVPYVTSRDGRYRIDFQERSAYADGHSIESDLRGVSAASLAERLVRPNPSGARWRANHHGGWHAPGDPLGYTPRRRSRGRR